MLTELCTTIDEKGASLRQTTLTVSTELRKFGLLLQIAPSSNGKTADSGPSSGRRVLRALLPPYPIVDKIVC